MRVASLIVVISLIVLGVYSYGLSTKYKRDQQSNYDKENNYLSSCVGSYTGRDESGWAWAAYSNTKTSDIAALTNTPENVVRDCLDRWKEVNR